MLMIEVAPEANLKNFSYIPGQLNNQFLSFKVLLLLTFPPYSLILGVGGGWKFIYCW